MSEKTPQQLVEPPTETSQSVPSFWTNPSAKLIAKDQGPIEAITARAREVVYKAIEDGWKGPPFDPFWLATYRKIEMTPRDDIPDARLIPDSSQGFRIEFNPNQPPARVRFSLAHEIGHTLFPDCGSMIRNRIPWTSRGDAWQLELLCNVAAAEILMPPDPLLGYSEEGAPTFQDLPAIWRKFNVSAEALLIRIARLTREPISVFAASRITDSEDSEFRIDYCIPSTSSTVRIPSGMVISRSSVLSSCTAIGFTDHRVENWPRIDNKLYVECVGIPPYPERIFPRILGIVRLPSDHQQQDLQIHEIFGDVTQPRGQGHRIIAHIVNERVPTWGAGVAFAIAKRWPAAQDDFRAWTETSRGAFQLGAVHEFKLGGELSLVSMVAQHGYGASRKPRIRYSALALCLSKLAFLARNSNASVHIPRIGTGNARGSWEVIQGLVRECLLAKGVEVVVYTLPGPRGVNPQTSLCQRIFDSQT